MTEDRLQTIRAIWKDHHWLYTVAGIFIGLLIYPAFQYAVEDLASLLQAFVPEAIGVAFTVFLIDQLNQRREENRRTKNLKEQWVREAGSPAHAVAITAIDTLRKRGWLGRKSDTESLLEHADLSNADLHDVDLEQVNLSGATLWKANLDGADLRRANLSGANLRHSTLISASLGNASLSRANLRNVNFSNANLGGANLTGVNLESANLSATFLHGATLTNANLWKANLAGADLRDVNLTHANLKLSDINDALIQPTTLVDETTILPDGSHWSAGRDFAEFGAETREIVAQDFDVDDLDQLTYTFTFEDGTVRRHKALTGWLDDRDGNPIDEA